MAGFDIGVEKRQYRMRITKDTQVEEIMKIKGVVSYFIEHGVSPISCSGAFPQSLGKLLSIKEVADPDAFIEGLNAYVADQAQPGQARQ
jgi:hypothetical protein